MHMPVAATSIRTPGTSCLMDTGAVTARPAPSGIRSDVGTGLRPV